MNKWPTYKELLKKCEELESDINSTLEQVLYLANHGYHDGRGGDYESAASRCLDVQIIAKEYFRKNKTD